MALQPHICGCYYLLARKYYATKRVYLPQVSLKAHVTILETTSRTLLTQTFTNPSKSKGINEIRYTFPLFDGVSVVGFTCTIGDRVIVGEVKEKEKARAVYKDAVSKGKTAGLLEELPDASEIFTTLVGNVPPGATVVVDITYLGELKHDAEVDGVRLTIPTTIAPRYGEYPGSLAEGYKTTTSGNRFEVTLDARLSHGYVCFCPVSQNPTGFSVANIVLALLFNRFVRPVILSPFHSEQHLSILKLTPLPTRPPLPSALTARN